MAVVAGRAWGWLRSWTRTQTPDGPQKEKSSDKWRWGSWLWGGGRPQEDLSSPVEQYWEAQEGLQPATDDKDPGMRADAPAQMWWKTFLPTSYLWGKKVSELGRPQEALSRDMWGRDVEGDCSDYTTPPPSPTPSSRMPSPFRLFTHSWRVEVHPEHYEICFNFLRHLFDLFVVGFLWTVSPPTKLLLELLGVQGALRLWFHGMAMFLVSTTGMAGLLWLIQEYLPQFALIYGIIQAAVISVSIRQSVMLGTEEDGDLKDGKDVDACQKADVPGRDTKKIL